MLDLKADLNQASIVHSLIYAVAAKAIPSQILCMP